MYVPLEAHQNLRLCCFKCSPPVFCDTRLFLAELPHLQDSFVDKLLELMPRLSSCKPAEMVKILQTTLRQSGLLQLRLPVQVWWKHGALVQRVSAKGCASVQHHNILTDSRVSCLWTDTSSNSHHHRAHRGVRQPAEVHVWPGGGAGHRCNAGARPGTPEHRESPGELQNCVLLDSAKSFALQNLCLDTYRWSGIVVKFSLSFYLNPSDFRSVFLQYVVSLTESPAFCASSQVLYPDGQSHVIHPKPGDFRKPGPDRHRLITQVYLSHTAWTGK